MPLVVALALAFAALLAGSAAAGMTGVVADKDAEIRPAFDPSIERYAIFPGSDPELSIKVSADPTDTITINGAPAATGISVSLPALNMGARIPISVTNAAGATTRIELVYVPREFPRLETTILTDGVAPGHLYVGIDNFAAILDNNGVPYWLRKEPRPVIDFKKHPNGKYSYGVRTAGTNRWDRVNIEQVVLDENFNEIGRYKTKGLGHTDGHDFLLLENGNRVHVAYVGAKRRVKKGAPKPNGFVEDSVVQEINPRGKVVFQWNSWGDIPYREVPKLFLRRGKREYAHLNSIDVDHDGHYLFSLRGTAQVIKVHRRTGKVIWKLGGKSSDFKILGDPFRGFCGQHTAERLDNGNILLYDNGVAKHKSCAAKGPPRKYTRVAEYAIHERLKIAQLVWSWSDGTFSGFAGSSQRLPSGNTLVGWGGNGAKLATEVSYEGAKVFEIRGTVGVSDPQPARSYRVKRFAGSVYPVAPTAPRNIARPRVTGKVKAGGTLTCRPGGWDVVPNAAFTYSWRVAGERVAEGQTYVLPAKRLARSVACEVVASSAAGSGVAHARVDTVAPRVRLRATRLPIAGGRRLNVALHCPAHELGGCRITLKASITGIKSKKAVVQRTRRQRVVKTRGVRRTAAAKRIAIKIKKPGETRVLKWRLTPRQMKAVRALGRRAVRFQMIARDGGGNTRSVRMAVPLKRLR